MRFVNDPDFGQLAETCRQDKIYCFVCLKLFCSLLVFLQLRPAARVSKMPHFNCSYLSTNALCLKLRDLGSQISMTFGT